MDQPRLQTERLLLRPLTLADAPAVARLAGDRRIAATTLHIPHPYPEERAVEWIGTQAQEGMSASSFVFGVVLKDGGELVGAVGLSLAAQHERAEIGYWVGVPWWGQGLVTEACRAVIGWAFGELRLGRVHAHHMEGNEASGAVMRKLAMSYEGRLRKHVVKWGEPRDIECYGVLREEWTG